MFVIMDQLCADAFGRPMTRLRGNCPFYLWRMGKMSFGFLTDAIFD